MLISLFAQKGGFGLLNNTGKLNGIKIIKNAHIYLTKHGKILRFLL